MGISAPKGSKNVSHKCKLKCSDLIFVKYSKMTFGVMANSDGKLSSDCGLFWCADLICCHCVDLTFNQSVMFVGVDLDACAIATCKFKHSKWQVP